VNEKEMVWKLFDVIAPKYVYPHEVSPLLHGM
jgi:hypothetical protein